ncbi:hypothetical protein PR202_ga21001 [Eleusine coracana subsp. coracana]|uniref:RING-type E3 ubiquitin transferase n=1 Tax=Eleusine coracana subsp. coracana TaxID=191504 RepID=A0AAV5CZQ6_ELECO|nr:hypothetical protein PR202_ga21001 [Eleusine coracana subsp. coracana]
MGAARRWKLLLPFRSPVPRPAASNKPKYRVQDVLATTPSPPRKEEEVPGELVCPILGLPMADPVILSSGRTYERACVRACADLGLALGPDGAVVAAAIPNDALRAAVRTWCARSGRAPPVPPSVDKAMEAVLRAAPARSASNLSCSTSRASAASTSPSTSSSGGGSSTEMAPAVDVEVNVVRVKDVAAKEAEQPVLPVAADSAEEEEDAWARAVEAGDETEVEWATSSLRRATRESPARRRALCTPRLLAALRRALLLPPRHATPASRADAAAALANLALEPENRVPVVRAGAVPALVDALASPASPPEAREHAAGAMFALALHEGNRAALGVLGAVPPLLAVFSDHRVDHGDGDGALPPRARRDAGMALYHLSLAAVNQSKIARALGGVRALLGVASDADEPAVIRRLALMVACNVAACAEGRAALMDAGAVATVTAILSGDGAAAPNNSEDLQQCCVAALYGMSRGSARRFRGLARAAGADRPLTLVVERASPVGVHKEMAHAVLRVISALGDNDDDGSLSDREGGSFASARSQRRRAASWAAATPPAAAATPPNAHQWRSVCID